MLGLTIGIILEGYTGKGILAQVSDLDLLESLWSASLRQYLSRSILADRARMLVLLYVEGGALGDPHQEVFQIYLVLKDLFAFSKENVLNVDLKCQFDYFCGEFVLLL